MENVIVNGQKKVRFIFSKRMAEYLINSGFFNDLKSIEKNKRLGQENKRVYVFYESDKLNDSIDKYLSEKNKA